MEIRDIEIRIVPDDMAWEYVHDMDEEDRAEYEKNPYGFIGIKAVAIIVVNGTIQTIESGGLWGIDDTSESADYRKLVGREEMSELLGILLEMGAPQSEVDWFARFHKVEAAS